MNPRSVLSLMVASLILPLTGPGPSRAQDVCSYRTPGSAGAVDVLVADFNQDGYNDFAARSVFDLPTTPAISNGRVTIFSNNIPLPQGINGLFDPVGISYDPGVPANASSGPFAAGDFDGDGFPDLVFLAPDPNPTTGDLEYSVLLNTATPATAFVPIVSSVAPPGSAPYQGHTGIGIVAGDFSGDGLDDFAIVHGNPGAAAANDELQVFTSNGAGTFTASAPLLIGEARPRRGDAVDIRLGDIDGDGLLDVGVLYRTRTVGNAPDEGSGLSLFRNTGAGLAPAANYPAPGGSNYRTLLDRFVLADANVDGIDDYLAVGAIIPVPAGPSLLDFTSVIVNEGAPNYGFPMSGLRALEAMPSVSLDIVARDLDNDGDADAVVSTLNNGGVAPAQIPGFTLLAGNGNGTIGPAQPAAPFVPLDPVGAMALGNIDGTQNGDLVIASPVNSVAGGVPSSVVNLVLGRAPCPLDINCNGSIDPNDSLALLAAFGPCPIDGACRADLTGDGQVTFDDFLALSASPCITGAGGACNCP